MLTLVVTWLGTRRDVYLLSWGVGLGFVGPSAVLYGWFPTYEPAVQCSAFLLLLTGYAFIYVGSAQFSSGKVRWRLVMTGWATACLLMIVTFSTGFSGVGTIVLNAGAATFSMAAGLEHWRARSERPVAMDTMSAIYIVTSVSFVLCAAVLIAGGQWELTARPQNWAEDLNSMAVIASLAMAGAVTMALHQFRITSTHRQLAMTDDLTGLLNRRALFGIVGTAPVASSTAVIMLDLDDFKAINDRFGHAVGDEVLSRFAAILVKAIGPKDIAARIGGEEFCLLLQATEAPDAHGLAERIRQDLENTQPLPDGYGPPTVSAGIAVATPKGETFDHLLRAADELLYRAKKAGRNRVHGPEPRLVA